MFSVHFSCILKPETLEYTIKTFLVFRDGRASVYCILKCHLQCWKIIIVSIWRLQSKPLLRLIIHTILSNAIRNRTKTKWENQLKNQTLRFDQLNDLFYLPIIYLWVIEWCVCFFFHGLPKARRICNDLKRKKSINFISNGMNFINCGMCIDILESRFWSHLNRPFSIAHSQSPNTIRGRWIYNNCISKSNSRFWEWKW